MGLDDLTLIFGTRSKLVLETHLRFILLRKQDQWKTSENIYLLANFDCVEKAII